MADISGLINMDIHRRKSTLRVSKQQDVVYLNVPKCGCTNIKVALWRSAGAKEPFFNSLQFDKNLLYSFDFRRPRLEKMKGNNPFVFTIVRNPFARIYSGYVDKVSMCLEDPERDPMKVLDEEFLSKGKTTFTDFLLYLKSQNDEDRNIHFRSASYQANIGIVKADYIGYLENIEESVKFLSSKIDGFRYSIRSDNITGSKNTLMDTYTNEHVDLVKEIYAKDFENFGYSTNIDDAMIAPSLLKAS